MMRAIIRSVFALGAWLSVACGAELDSPAISQSSQRIIQGDPSPAATNEDAVLLLRRTADTAFFCTATLIAPNLVITTRHCVAAIAPGKYDCPLDGTLVSVDPGAGVLGDDYVADTLELYGADVPREVPLARGSQIVSSLSDSICLDDIAFVVLDTALELPTLALRVNRPVEHQDPIKVVGYGVSVMGQQLDYRTQERRQLSGLEVKYIGPSSVERGFEASPRTFIVDGPASCYGDSGGPAISEETGAVLGVFSSLEGSNCEEQGVDLRYTQTSPFAELTATAFAAAGAEPNLEPEPQPDPPADAGVNPAHDSPEPVSCQLASGRAGGGVLWALALSASSLLRRRRGTHLA